MAAPESRLRDDPLALAGLPPIACLEEFWAAHVAGGLPLDEMVAKVLLDTLGLGNQQVYRFLFGASHHFADFCRWIAETVGPPDAVLLDRYHAWLTGEAPGAVARAQLAAVAAMDPVLDASQLAHWHELGYVVLPVAISAEQATAVRDLIWQTTGATPDDPASWYGAREDGIMVARFQHPALEAARRSPRIHKAFSQLWGSENLWVTIDRMGFNPPVTPEHPFAGSELHWDVSLAQPIPFGTQAVLYLADTAADQGAFRCVPGFHREIDEWLDRLGDEDPRRVDLSAREVYVAGKAGDLVIWRQDLPHGASPNRAGSPRLAQYLNYYSPDMEVRRRWR